MLTRRVVVKPWNGGYELYMGSRLGSARMLTWDEAEHTVRDLVGRCGKSVAFRIAWDFDGCEDPREKAAAEREAAEGERPSMFQAAVEAAAGTLPDAPTATVEQVALAVLRVALPLHETQHADAWKAAHERAVHFEWELEQLRAQLGEPETQWGHQVHAADGHRGDEVSQVDENAARLAVAYMNERVLPADARAVLIQREVRVHEGPWRVAPACECPHTYQLDGSLVRDGVLAAGCPVHDADVKGDGDV